MYHCILFDLNHWMFHIFDPSITKQEEKVLRIYSLNKKGKEFKK